MARISMIRTHDLRFMKSNAFRPLDNDVCLAYNYSILIHGKILNLENWTGPPVLPSRCWFLGMKLSRRTVIY